MQEASLSSCDTRKEEGPQSSSISMPTFASFNWFMVWLGSTKNQWSTPLIHIAKKEMLCMKVYLSHAVSAEVEDDYQKMAPISYSKTSKVGIGHVGDSMVQSELNRISTPT
jgi:hypothetical protein